MTTAISAHRPSVAPAVLRENPCIRVDQFFPVHVAAALRHEIRDGLQYERVELGSMTRQWRASRPVGNGYFGPMARRPGWESPQSAQAAIAYFDSAEFVRWLSGIAGEELEFRRPVTAYKLDRGDRICLHDDMSDPSHAVSIAYNLSGSWRPECGGSTVFGNVVSVTPADTPWDCPIDLYDWRITNEQRLIPEFNSLLIMRLGTEFAHGVEEVTGDASRLSIIGIYGRVGSSLSA